MFAELKMLARNIAILFGLIFIVFGLIFPGLKWLGETIDTATQKGMHPRELIVRFGDPATLTDEIQLAQVVDASDLSDAAKKAGVRAREVHCVAGTVHTVFNLPDIHSMDSPVAIILAAVGKEPCESGHILTYHTMEIRITPNQ